MASPAQIEANRRNALKSTGPKTPEGKDASRRNALKHGLAAETLVLPGEEAEAVAARLAAWTPSLKPVGEYDAWLVEEVVLHSLRIDRCRAHESAIRNRNARRAAVSWDEDRRAEAEVLGTKLSRSPALTLHKLRSTKQGCDWLIARWEGLLAALESEGGWDAAREKLALDLLGTPKEMRLGGADIGCDRRALVERELAALRSFRDGAMAELDELERAATEVGLGPDDKEVRLARRYEAACVRRMEWARKQIGKGQPAGIEVVPCGIAVPEAHPEVTDRTQSAAPSPALSRAIPPQTKPILAEAPMPASPVGPRPIVSALGNRKERRALKALARRA